VRWIPLLILTYLLVVVQTTLGRLLVFSTAIGPVGPDLLAPLAVFVAFGARSWPDAMLAAWAMGLAVDLATAGGPAGATVVGPMAVAYALTAGVLFRVREAFFRERVLTQGLLTCAFCLLAHGLWITAQSLLAPGAVPWSLYGRAWGQVAAVGLYTAVLTPLLHYAFSKTRRWILVGSAGAVRRGRR